MKNRLFMLLMVLLLCAVFASCGILSNDDKSTGGKTSIGEICTAKYDFEMNTEWWCEPEYGRSSYYSQISVNTVCVSGRDHYPEKYRYETADVYFIMPDGREIKAESLSGFYADELDMTKGDSFNTTLYVHLPAEYVPGTCDVKVQYSGSVKIFENVTLNEKAIEYETVPYEIQAELVTFERADELVRDVGAVEYPITALVVTQPSAQLSHIYGGNGSQSLNIEKYTAEFFENNFVIVVYKKSGSTGYAFETTLSSADESLVTIETVMVDFPRRGSIVGWMEEHHVMLVEVPVKYAGQAIECRYSVPLSLRSEYE